ncbi:hypothetical protein V2J09_018442 [Rumex salicifolius]
MRVLSDSWCFCNGGGKSERLKGTIFSSKSAAMAMLSSSSTSTSSDTGDGGSGGEVVGTGFLIHRNLLLTTHVNLPSASAAESAEIRLQNGVPVTLVPHRFFITSSILDLTIVGLDYTEGDSNAHGHQTHCLKTCSKPNLDLGSIVYLLGYTAKKELTVGEGKVIIATDNLIKLSTDGLLWRPGSAGFDAHGNLAFMICDPMKMATSPHTKSSSTSTSSSSSWKKDLPMQFGIPMPVICDWLNQHWEGSLDEQSKPKLPLMRLVSAGHRSEHHCASFSKRQIFKPTGAETEMSASSSSNVILKPNELPGSSGSAADKAREEDGKAVASGANTHAQGIPTPEIYESPKVTATPIKKKETPQVPLLDINFPQRVSKAPIPLQSVASENAEAQENDRGDENAEVSSTGSVNLGQIEEVLSSASPMAGSEFRDGQSEVETMYSAETAESRNYTSPRETKFQQPVGRSQSCVNYNRWAVHKYPVARKTSFDKQRSFTQPRRTYSQGATSHRSNDYYSPTVSSIMKKRIGNLETPPQPTPVKTRQILVNSSPRWMF